MAAPGHFLGWGRRLQKGSATVTLAGQVLLIVNKIVYGIDIKRIMRSKLVLGVADGRLSADGPVVYCPSDLKVGVASALR